jgi:hypothetical protein
MTSVNGIGFSRDAIDATHMQSANGYREMIFGLKQAKPMTFEFNLVPSGVGALQTITEGSASNWQVLFPDNSSLTFACRHDRLRRRAMTPEGKLSASFVLTPSGKPTWA